MSSSVVPPAPSNVSSTFVTMVSGALWLVAAMAWSDALKLAFELLKPFGNRPVLGAFVHAAAVTLIAYVGIRALSRRPPPPEPTAPPR